MANLRSGKAALPAMQESSYMRFRLL